MTCRIGRRAMHRAAWLPALAGCALLLLAGCGGAGAPGPEGPTGTVSGMATRKGAPLTAGRITFVSTQDGANYFGDIASDGSFAVAGQFGADLPVGDYMVGIAPAAAPFDPMAAMEASPMEGDAAPAAQADASGDIPAKYRSAATSGITKTVAEGANDMTIDIPE